MMSKVLVVWEYRKDNTQMSVVNDDEAASNRIKDLMTSGVPAECITVYRADDGHSVKICIDG